MDPGPAPVDVGGPDVADARPPSPLRRSWGQRLVLGTGIVLSLAAIAAAVTVGWAAWKYRSIHRADVALDTIVGEGPRNYLIVGSDSRSNGDPTDPRAVVDHQPLADTIMVLRVDPKTRQAKVLSLPRDLWVTLVGIGRRGRINEAYATGGPQRLVDTLQAELAIPIHHYVEVDFAGFQKMVESVDGVPVWFDRAMRDSKSGLDVLHPGCTTLDGYGALAFARARHLEYFARGGFRYDGTGDLGRISRQQLFMRRFIDRAKAKGIRNPLTAKGLVDTGVDSITIDRGLSVGDLLALGRRFSSFRSNALVSYTVPATPRTTDAGAQVLDLDGQAAQPILDQFRDLASRSDTAEAASGSPGDATTTAGEPAVRAADVKLWVLNSSGRQGLASKVADQLTAHGYPVDHWGNGAELDHPNEARTTIRYAPRADGPADLVSAGLAGQPRTVLDGSLDRGQVVVYLGNDFTKVIAGTSSAPKSTATPKTTTTTAPPPPPTEVVGVVPGDPPPGRSCG